MLPGPPRPERPAKRGTGAQTGPQGAGGALHGEGGEAQRAKRADDPARRPEGEHQIAGKECRRHQQQAQKRQRGKHIGRARPAVTRARRLAVECSRAHLARPGKRPEGEDQHAEHTVERRLDHRGGIDGKDRRHRQARGDERPEQDRQADAEDQPAEDAQNGQNADLKEICQEDRPLIRAEAAQGGDDLHLAREIAAQRRRDADAAHGKARQAHQHEEGPEPGDEFSDAGAGVAGVVPAKAAAVKFLGGDRKSVV